MTVPAFTIGPDDTVRRAAARMATLALKRLPVVDVDGRLVGIISQRDILRLMYRSDDEVDRAVTAELARLTTAIDVRDVRATTADGVVTLAGTAPTSADIERILRAVHAAPGVIDVDNMLAVDDRGRADHPANHGS